MDTNPDALAPEPEKSGASGEAGPAGSSAVASESTPVAPASAPANDGMEDDPPFEAAVKSAAPAAASGPKGSASPPLASSFGATPVPQQSAQQGSPLTQQPQQQPQQQHQQQHQGEGRRTLGDLKVEDALKYLDEVRRCSLR